MAGQIVSTLMGDLGVGLLVALLMRAFNLVALISMVSLFGLASVGSRQSDEN